MTTGRDFLWQEMLRVWQRLDEAKRREAGPRGSPAHSRP